MAGQDAQRALPRARAELEQPRRARPGRRRGGALQPVVVRRARTPSARCTRRGGSGTVPRATPAGRRCRPRSPDRRPPRPPSRRPRRPRARPGPATAPSIARRWSPCASIAPPRSPPVPRDDEAVLGRLDVGAERRAGRRRRAAIRSDSLTRSSPRAADDGLALGEAAEQRDQRQLVDRQRDLVGARPSVPTERRRAATSSSPTGSSAGDRRRGSSRSPSDDRAHALERSGGSRCASSSTPTSLEHDPRAGHEHGRRGDGTRPRTGRRARATSSSSSSSLRGDAITCAPSRAIADAGARRASARCGRGSAPARSRVVAPGGQQPGEQHARLHLRASRPAARSRSRAAARRATVNGGKRPSRASMPRAHRAQRRRRSRSTGRRRIDSSPSSVHDAARAARRASPAAAASACPALPTSIGRVGSRGRAQARRRGSTSSPVALLDQRAERARPRSSVEFVSAASR